MRSEEALVTILTAAGLLGYTGSLCPALGQPLHLGNEGLERAGVGPIMP